MLLSAQDTAAVDRTAAWLATHLDRRAPALGEVAATLAVGRADLPARIAVTARDTGEAARRLASGENTTRGEAAEPAAPAVFLFPGQGAQRPGMALPLRAALPGFDDALENCLDAFPSAVTNELRHALMDPDFPEERLAATDLAQPALFAVEHAAAAALRGLGVAPVAVAGHSLGEITAICSANGLTLPDAARLVSVRGRAMADCPPGAMLALGCDEATARELVSSSGRHLELAAHNSPESCVLAGSEAEIEGFGAWLGERVHTTRLRTGRAFHSELIDAALPPLSAVFSSITPHPTLLPVAANAAGDILPPGSVLSAEHFTEQARGTVRFADLLAALARRYPGAVAIEVGPDRVLSAMAAAAGLTPVALCPNRTDRPAEEVLAALGTLWTLGQPLSPSALCGPGQRLHLPTYPFAGPRWIAPEAAAEITATPSERTAALQSSEGAVAQEAPTDPTKVLTELWADLLGHTELTADSDFFELGGDSLLITHLARRIKLELGLKVRIREMFTARTLGQQREIILGLVDEQTGVLSP